MPNLWELFSPYVPLGLNENYDVYVVVLISLKLSFEIFGNIDFLTSDWSFGAGGEFEGGGRT